MKTKQREAVALQNTLVASRKVGRAIRGPSVFQARARLLRSLLRDARLERYVQMVR